MRKQPRLRSKAALWAGVSLLAFGCLQAMAQSSDYAAIAAGPRGSAYVNGYAYMEEARNAAVLKCRQILGTSCSVSTAEDASWYFSAAFCDGEAYTAASPESQSRADALIREKAFADGRTRCHIFEHQTARR